ncbi:SprT family zinc-dependent metalloprotease [Glycomyces sp. NPDC047010]|uniref:M48 family metallopeptidase n=1 Tax=Glycomyces sp. NPDC047010 TaxID=3155023 RepID=UPI0033FEEF18
MTISTLEVDGMSIPVQIGGRPRAAKLTIERDGSLQLVAAADVRPEELRLFVDAKREWIYRKLAEKEALPYDPPVKQIVNGEGFLYLGRNHQLRIIETDRSEVLLDHGRLTLPRNLRAEAPEAIIAWYRKCGESWLRSHTGLWAKRLEVEPVGQVEVTDVGHRWGAATAAGRVRIHWATMQLRPLLVEYVLVHELAHLREPHHGPAFWRLLGRAMPDCQDRKSELAQVGQRIWLGQVV